MDLPVMPPVKPMLSKSGTFEKGVALLDKANGLFEPKWDGLVLDRAGEPAAACHPRSFEHWFQSVLASPKTSS